MVALKSFLLKCAVFVLLFSLSSNCVDAPDPDAILCTDPLFPYLCSSSGKCCSLPFYGKNLNKCYGRVSECGTVGQSCEACGIELNNTIALEYVYANWDCDGSADCEANMGAASGTAGPFCGEADCEAWGEKFVPSLYTCDKTPLNTPTIGAPPDGICFKAGDF